MIALLTGAAVIYGVTLAALIFLGLGLTRLILPAAFGAETLIWSPFVGYTFMAIGFHMLNVQFLSGFVTAIILLVLAGVALIASFVVRRPQSWGSAALAASLLAVVTAVYFVGLAPLASQGALTAIGKNWDLIDIYDPTAAYVIDHPVSQIVSASPPNPLALSVTSPSTLSNGWGPSYLQALATILSRHSPIETQAPIMSLMHALMVPALFVLFRRTLGLKTWLSLIISAALATQALIVWTLLHGLGNNIAILAMLPLVFASSILALNTRKVGAIAFAAFMLTNIPLTYWSAFAFYIPPMVLYVVLGQPFRLSLASLPAPVRFLIPERAIVRELGGGDAPMGPMFPFPTFKWGLLFKRGLTLAGIFAGSVVLAVAGYQRILATALYAWRNRNSTQPILSQGFGDKQFLNISNLTGFSYWTWPAPKPVAGYVGVLAANLISKLESVALVLAVLLVVYALLRLPWRRKSIMLSFGLGYLALLLYLRFVAEYYYAYMKAFTFAAFVFLGLAAIGLRYWWASGKDLRAWLRWPSRTLAGLTSVLFAALLVFNGTLATAFYFNQPQTALTGSVLPPSSLALEQMVKLIPPGVPVFMTESPPLRPEIASPLAFFLRSHPLYGRIKTFESELNNPPPAGVVPDYGVLAASEDPADRGYLPQDLVWSNSEVKLYKRSTTIAHYLFTAAQSLAITPQQPLDFTMTAGGIELGKGAAPANVGTGPQRQLVIELGSLKSQTVDVLVNGQARHIDLSPGLARYGLESLPTPAQVSVRSTAGSPLFVRSLSLLDEPSAASFLSQQRDVLVAVPTVKVEGSVVHLDLQYAGADQFTDQLVVGLNVGGNALGGEWVGMGWWGTDLRRSQIQLDLNLQTKDATARTDQQELHVNSDVGDTKNGDYTGMFNIWNWSLAQTGWHSPFYNLFKFSIRNDQIGTPQVQTDPVIFLPMRSNYPVAPEAAAPYLPQLSELQGHLPQGAQVMLSPTLLSTPAALGALAANLKGVNVFADFLTGAQYVEPGHVYDYAIMAAKDDPSSLGYQDGSVVWTGKDFKLFKRGTTLVHLDLKRDGNYPKLTAGQQFVFYPDANQVYTQETLKRDTALPGTKRQVTISLASVDAAAAAIRVNNGPAKMVNIPSGGLFQYRTPPIDVPSTISVTGQSDVPIFVSSVDLGLPTSATGQTSENTNALVMSVNAREIDQSTLDLQVSWAGGGDPSRLFFMGVNAGGNADKEGQWFSLGWWGVPMPSQDLHMQINLSNRNAQANADGTPLQVSTLQAPLRNANYNVGLSLWESGLAQRGWPTPFIPVLHFSSTNMRPTNAVPESTQLSIIPLLPSTATS
ncbi:MAG TPA: hypothetical protein VMW62_03365 [Chloroflexota bacterium]|nr:hypothetical protein [Chloroflexota bacterium]